MEYIAVLKNYLEYNLDDKHTVNLSLFLYWLKPRLNSFFCIAICAFIFEKIRTYW